MKIDRRSFLSLGIGAAAGTALTPLPWKLMDDVSIWSQNWPWTPVPEDGEVTYAHSTCSLCPGGCGISVRKVKDRAVKIEGMAGHPVNKGGICMLGLAGLQLLYGPTRVSAPLKRIGKRGEGKWQKISWREAIAEVVNHLSQLREKGEAHTVAGIMDRNRGTVPQLFERLLTAYGSPNFFRMPSVQDTHELVLHLMHGVQALAGYDVENADLIVSFGSGIIDGWGSPVRMFRANSGWKASGVKVIQVEPCLSNTAAKADIWVPINPGTEAALALGIAHVIIRENRASEFVAQYGFGFLDWTDENGKSINGFKTLVMAEYSPEKVAEITGVDANRIIELAQAVMKAKRPLALGGRGQGWTPGSTRELMAIHALNALVGNINQPGGVWAIPEPDYIRWPDPEMDQVAANGIQKGRLDGAGGQNNPYSRYLLNRLAQAVTDAKPYPVNALFVAEANPCYSLPDVKAVQAAFDKIPFVVSFSSYMDETAMNADLILPNHVFLERYEDIPAPAVMHQPIIGLARPVVSPQRNTRHLGDVVIEIAKGLGGSVASAFPWTDYMACMKEALGGKWERMAEDGFWINKGYTPPEWEKAFDTPSKKFEFSATALLNVSDAYPNAVYQPVTLEGDKSFFPLVMIFYDSMRLSSGYVGSPPFLIKTVPDTVIKGADGFVEINPETARKQSLAEGDAAVLQTPKAKIRVRVHLNDGIRPGVLAMARGLGHTAYDEYLKNKGVNVNALKGVIEDPISGLDAAWGIRAKLVKA
ncbi:MAG: menaquinone reductase molybdopterin-binding-like subunit QrcB [Desulfobacterales bacterium]|jgi:anaerobic selenocysteine-containing dehydrogenase|nr:menaquinone reductase molybdopterin-binding-like subunit QrcB [Desulfobacterales bacterium]